MNDFLSFLAIFGIIFFVAVSIILGVVDEMACHDDYVDMLPLSFATLIIRCMPTYWIVRLLGKIGVFLFKPFSEFKK